MNEFLFCFLFLLIDQVHLFNFPSLGFISMDKRFKVVASSCKKNILRVEKKKITNHLFLHSFDEMTQFQENNIIDHNEYFIK